MDQEMPNQFRKYLNQIETEIEASLQIPSYSSSASYNTKLNEDRGSIESRKRQQIDAWLEMSNEKLVDECKRLGLPAVDDQITNMKTLTEHLDSELAG